MLYEILPAHIQRRISFLRTEASLDSPRDQIITYCMRVLSNYASVGVDGGSTLIKRKNKKISRGALEKMFLAESVKDWASQCINEHPTPLKETWQWMKMHAEDLDNKTVWGHLVENSMVTISIEEDAALSKLGLRSNGSGKERYETANIKVSVIETAPEDLFSKIKMGQKKKI